MRVRFLAVDTYILAGMRWLMTVVVIAMCGAGCGGSKARPDGTGGGGEGSGSGFHAAPRLDLHCTPQAKFDEAECRASGKDCRFGPPLICRGIDVPDDIKQQEREVYEAGTAPCVCSCEEDRVRCSMVP